MGLGTDQSNLYDVIASLTELAPRGPRAAERSNQTRRILAVVVPGSAHV